MNKRLRACIALVLMFTLLLPSYAFADLKPGETEKARVELVYMDDSYNIIPAKDIRELNVNDKFFVGVRLVDFDHIAEANKRVGLFSSGIVYDSTYLTVEPAIQAEIESQKQQYEDASLPFGETEKKGIIASAWNTRMNAVSDNAINFSYYKFKESIPALDKALDGYSGSTYTASQKSLVFATELNGSLLQAFNGVVADGKNAIVGVFEFEVKSIPADGD